MTAKKESRVIVVKDDAHFDEVIESLKVESYLIDYGATWCGPCKALDRVMKEVFPEFEKDLTLLKVNVDTAPNAAEGVTSVPTLFMPLKNLYMHQDGPYSKYSLHGVSVEGAMDPKALRRWIKKSLAHRDA